MNWKFALCLIALYVIGINCRSIETKEGEETPPKPIEHTFVAGEKVGKTDQVVCVPDDLCKKVAFKKILCKGNLSPPINDKKAETDYTCESEEYTKTTEHVQWTYAVNCTDTNKIDSCHLDIALKDTTPEPPKSKAGLIIGIIAAVIVVLVGIVALLGYRGIGPMRGVFGK